MDDTERAEFIGAVVQLTRAIQQILGLTERLLGMSGDVRGFSAQELIDARAQVALWRQQVDALTIHVGSLTVQPPDRPQWAPPYRFFVARFLVARFVVRFWSPWSPKPDFAAVFAWTRRSALCDRPTSSISLN